MLESLQSIFDEPWKPVSRPALVAWLIFYVAFLVYAFSAHGGFLFIDSANLVVHEGGHNLFSWFGPTLCLWGGTLLQWLVSFLFLLFSSPPSPPPFLFFFFFFFFFFPTPLLFSLDLHGRRARTRASAGH